MRECFRSTVTEAYLAARKAGIIEALATLQLDEVDNLSELDLLVHPLGLRIQAHCRSFSANNGPNIYYGAWKWLARAAREDICAAATTAAAAADAAEPDTITEVEAIPHASPELTVPFFETAIRRRKLGDWLTYTPNCRYDAVKAESIKTLQPGDFNCYYAKGNTAYYVYRSLDGCVATIVLRNGRVNSVYPSGEAPVDDLPPAPTQLAPTFGAGAAAPATPPRSATGRQHAEAPPAPRKLQASCTSCRCVCESEDDRCLWWEENQAAMARESVLELAPGAGYPADELPAGLPLMPTALMRTCTRFSCCCSPDPQKCRAYGGPADDDALTADLRGASVDDLLGVPAAAASEVPPAAAASEVPPAAAEAGYTSARIVARNEAIQQMQEKCRIHPPPPGAKKQALKRHATRLERLHDKSRALRRKRARIEKEDTCADAGDDADADDADADDADDAIPDEEEDFDWDAESSD